MRRRIVPLLKIIGILLFIWILSRIDREQLWNNVKSADIGTIVTACVLLLGSYLAKGYRWHRLILTTHYRPTFNASWKLYSIGTFFGAITPAKLGEFGRVVFLSKAGISKKRSVLLIITERFYDIAVILILSILGVGVLFGWGWTLLCSIGVLIGCVCGVLLWKYARLFQKFFNLPSIDDPLLRTSLHLQLLLTTTVSWALYFAWAILLTWSLHLSVPLIPLVSVFIVTGILALLPIAPSGLGTRDAALLVLLQPFGVTGPEAIALSLLMFTTTLLLSSIGGWYWYLEPSHSHDKLHS